MALVGGIALFFLTLGGCTLPTSGADGGEDSPQPPRIVLSSAAGRQQAVPGSYCVTGPASGACADMAGPLVPRRLNVVRPAEKVVLSVAGARVVEGSFVVRELGCTDTSFLESDLPAGDEPSLHFELEPGAYQLDVFARFEGEDTSGDVSGTLGLLVDESRTLEVVRAAKTFFACPEG